MNWTRNKRLCCMFNVHCACNVHCASWNRIWLIVSRQYFTSFIVFTSLSWHNYIYGQVSDFAMTDENPTWLEWHISHCLAPPDVQFINDRSNNDRSQFFGVFFNRLKILLRAAVMQITLEYNNWTRKKQEKVNACQALCGPPFWRFKSW